MKNKHYVAAMISSALLLTGCQQMQTNAPEQDINIQTTTETQPTVSDTTAPEEDISTQTLTETQPPSTDNTPLTNIVRCDLIKLPDGISDLMMAERTADGFGCIAYNEDKQLTYLHISEDMQTSEAFVLTPVADQEKYYNKYRCFAFEEDGIWAIVISEGEQEQYLLCHYAKNGDLISAISANELQDYQIFDYQDLCDNFKCVDEMLYLTLYDGKVLQIDKETAKISVVSDLYKEDNSYNEKYLCFDRDDKPVLLQEKVTPAPDTYTIHEAIVSEFDLESGNCGQMLYITEDNWELKCFSIMSPSFSVLKGCGDYRLFINTSSELIGIRDDGTQELLIDIDASDLSNNDTIIDCLQPPYYTSDIKIIPVDDTQFLGLICQTPDYQTHAFCLTRKHESEIG